METIEINIKTIGHPNFRTLKQGEIFELLEMPQFDSMQCFSIESCEGDGSVILCLIILN